MTASVDVILFSLLLALPAAYYFQSWLVRKSSPPSSDSQNTSEKENAGTEKSEDKPIMQAERTDLAPPKDDPYTLEQLKEFDGSDPSKPIYVAIKGMSHRCSKFADILSLERFN